MSRPSTPRSIYTAIVSAAFLSMLAATKKREKPPENHPTPSPRSVPSTTGWQRNEVAGLRFFTPPFATIVREQVTSASIRVTMPSITVEFVSQTINFDSILSDYRAMGEYVYGFLLRAPDAIVAVRWDGKQIGEHCEVTACSAPIGEGSAAPRLCVFHAGVDFDKKLSDEECMAVVAIARSIQPL